MLLAVKFRTSETLNELFFWSSTIVFFVKVKFQIWEKIKITKNPDYFKLRTPQLFFSTGLEIKLLNYSRLKLYTYLIFLAAQFPRFEVNFLEIELWINFLELVLKALPRGTWEFIFGLWVFFIPPLRKVSEVFHEIANDKCNLCSKMGLFAVSRSGNASSIPKQWFL